MVGVGEDFILQGQKCPARIDQVEAGQLVFGGNLLGAQVLFDRQWEVGAAFHGGVVGDDQHFAARDAPDAGDQACARGFAAVKIPGGQCRKFEEWRARVEQTFDAFADEQLALFGVAAAVFFPTALADECNPLAQFGGQRALVF